MLGQAEAVFPTPWEMMEKWKEWEVVGNMIKKPEITEEEFLKALAERRMWGTQEVLLGQGKERHAVVVES